MSASHLPGFIRSVDLSPAPKWPIALRNTRALHGAMTVLDGRGHLRHRARFGFLPWASGSGWACQWYEDEAPVLPTENEAHVFNAVRRLRLGPPMKLKRPPVREAATLCVDTVTPVVVRHDGQARKEVDDLTSTLALSEVIRHVHGVGPRRMKDDELLAEVEMKVLSRDTRPERVHTGGSWGGCGTTIGWTGRVVVHANPVGRHLLELAALVGLGGRISLGFGRVTVREVLP